MNPIRVIEELTEFEWLQAVSNGGSFSFLNDPAEDIYTMDHGISFHDEVKISPSGRNDMPCDLL